MDKKEHLLDMYQATITRMASNSSNCKLWCITLLTGILVFFLQQSNISENQSKIILLPLIPFTLLDAYYLALEKHFRKLYNDLLNTNDDNTSIQVNGLSLTYIIINTMKAMLSFSIWGLYLVIGIILHTIIK